MCEANLQTTSVCIPIEVKSAINLRILAGGSYLDLVWSCDMGSKNSCAMIMCAITNWISRDEISEISIFNFLNDEESLKKERNSFSIG